MEANTSICNLINFSLLLSSIRFDEEVPCEFEYESKSSSCVNVTVYYHAINHNDISKCKGNIKKSEHESFLEQLRSMAISKDGVRKHQEYKLSNILKSKSKADDQRIGKIEFTKFSRIQSKCDNSLLNPNFLTVRPNFMKPKTRTNSKPKSKNSNITSKRSQTAFKRDRKKKKLRMNIEKNKDKSNNKNDSALLTPYFKENQYESEEEES